MQTTGQVLWEWRVASFFLCLQHCFPPLKCEHGYRKLSDYVELRLNPYGYRQICAPWLTYSGVQGIALWLGDPSELDNVAQVLKSFK